MAKKVKEIKETPGIRELPPANSVRIIYGKGEVRCESNGEIAGLEISYRGAFHGRKKLGAGWSIKANKTKILIFSLAQTSITELLFKYIGELSVVRATYVTWDNIMKSARIENLNKNDWNLAYGKWDFDGRKYEEIETEKIIHRKVLKTRI